MAQQKATQSDLMAELAEWLDDARHHGLDGFQMAEILMHKYSITAKPDEND
jgi:hypothetical protein